MSSPPIPTAPPSGFSAQNNGGQLVALKSLRVGLVDDAFGKSNRADGKVEATFLDVWLLTGPEAGQFYSETPNQSRLGRQFAGSAGNGFTYYGRIRAEKAGGGTSYILDGPWPGDEAMIAAHKAKLAGQQQAPAQGGYRQPSYSNEPAWNQGPPQDVALPPQQPAPQQGFQPPQQPAPQQPAAAGLPPGMTPEQYQQFLAYQQAQQAQSAAPPLPYPPQQPAADRPPF